MSILLNAFLFLEKEKNGGEVCARRSAGSGVSDSLSQHPEGSLLGSDKNQGAGKSWEAGRAQQAVGVLLLLL